MEYAAVANRNSGGIEFARALRSLKRHKRTPEYREQLVREIRSAKLAELEARTTMDTRKARLRILECETELDALNHGLLPDPYRGLVRFQMPDLEEL